MKKAYFLLFMATCMGFANVFAAEADPAPGVYVKAGSSGDGSSFDNAMGDIAIAVKDAKEKGLKFVYVADGDYSVAETLSVPAGITVVGEGDEVRLTVTAEKGDVVTLEQGTADAFARVEGLTIYGAKNGRGVKALNFGQVYNCVIENNKLGGQCAGKGDGGAGILLYASTLLERSIIRNNIADENVGGGIAVNGNNILVKNCLITGNKSLGKYINASGTELKSSTGGILFWAGYNGNQFVNLTVVGNEGYNVGGVWLSGSKTKTRWVNSVVWGNKSTWPGEEDPDMQDDIYFKLNSGASLGIYKCFLPVILKNNLDNDKVYAGVTQISTENDPADGELAGPRFTDPANGDYTLAAGSPLIDAGSEKDYDKDDADQIKVKTDLTIDGKLRKLGSHVDVGAYEYDENSSGIIATYPDFENETPVYYNLQGIRFNTMPTAAGIYIERRGSQNKKIIVK
ncbi:MAG: hypothetical protein HDS89_05050 [Bacteroidales bacterium]|nr:hypothetical protein [Bacteroidales bacterium]